MRARIALCLLLSYVSMPILCDTALANPQSESPTSEYLVGVYYFSGWWRELPNKYQTAGKDWRPEYPERTALLGEYNEQKTMDAEILAASKHGVNFFQLLWYDQGTGPYRERHQDKLNAGIEQFMASRHAGLMKFTIEYVNHPPFGITADDEWAATCRQWCSIMKHPSYLRVAGRPVFKVHGLAQFFKQCGTSPQQMAERIKTLRSIARQEGLADPLISAGIMAESRPLDATTAPFDFLTTYMDMPKLPQEKKPYPYSRLLAYAERAWLYWAEQNNKSYVPYVPAGWDPRPWKDPRPSFEFPTRDDWLAALRRAKSALDTYPALGIPTGQGKRCKMLLIYAWNEFSEGGIVAPTRGHGLMKLECIKEVFGSPKLTKKHEKLNVLFIMSDQHNARALGCYGNREIQTPNMDRLAREGVRFSHAFTQTGSCCPSRYTIWTGRYAHSHGLRSNGVTEPLDEITITELLRDAGYVVGSFGKHHMKHDLSKHGFHKVVGAKEYHQFLRADKTAHYKNDGKWLADVRLGNGPVGTTSADNEHHRPGFWTSEVIKFLRQNKDRPFYIHYSFYAPHTPIIASKPWAEMYDPAKLTLPGSFNFKADSMPIELANQIKSFAHLSEEMHRRILAHYYGLVSQIDYNIGRVLDELDRLGLTENTIVIYTADHGELAGAYHTWLKLIANYDATIQIPLIVRLPKQVTAGKVRHELVGLIDLMPTLCELTGVNIPKKVQGQSLVPLLEGKSADWRKVIFSEIGYPGRGPGRSVMARTHTHKYVHHENFSRKASPYEELFDLAKDPWEMKNEIDNPTYADVVNHLKKEIKNWEDTTDHAPMYPVQKEPRARKEQKRR